MDQAQGFEQPRGGGLVRTHWHRTTDGALHRPGPLAAWQGWATGTDCLGDSRPHTFFKELLSQGCGNAIYLLRRKQLAVRKSPCPSPWASHTPCYLCSLLLQCQLSRKLIKQSL